MKVGMINEWDPVWGEFHMCTVLQVEPTRVIQVKTKDTDGYDAIQLGTSVRKLKNFTKPELGHFKRWGNETPVRILKEFRVTPECLLPVGSHVGARHFIPGQHVDIQGTT
jgi:large subunit ribosomal protein L3